MAMKIIKALKNKLQKLKPMPVADGKCPCCGAKIPNGQPFWCCFCKQTLDYK